MATPPGATIQGLQSARHPRSLALPFSQVRPASCGVPVFLLAVAWVLLAGPASHAAEMGQSLGRLKSPGEGKLILPAVEGADQPWLSHLVVSREALKPADSALDSLQVRLAAAGHRLILTVEAGEVAGDMEAWTAGWSDDLLAGVAGLGPQVIAVAPGLPAGRRDAARDAYLLKQAAVAVHAAGPEVLVVLELHGVGVDMAWLAELYAEQLGPYVDVWAWRLAPGEPPPSAEAVRRLNRTRLDLDPAAPLWVLGLPSGGTGLQSPPALVGALHSAGAVALTFRVDRPAEAEMMGNLRVALPAGASPMASGAPLFRTMSGEPMDRIQAWSFFDASTSRAMVILMPLSPLPSRLQMELPTFDVSSPMLTDLQGGEPLDLGGGLPDRKRNRTLVTLVDVVGPGIVTYQRFASPGSDREDVAVDSSRDLTVEEILVRHQEVAAIAADRLLTISADARVQFHYTVAGSGATIDVAYDSRYYWDEEVGAEFEYLEMYLNGARWRKGKFPNLPLIEPEKVVTPPLQIALGRQYLYRLKGRDMVAGRPAWRIEFEPRDPEATRYSGTSWIDRETFRLLKQSVIQTGLEEPVLASEETSLFVSVPIPGGGEASVVASTRGQQRWNVGGASFVIHREVYFSSIRLNEPDFFGRRQEAYDSDHQMLRETDQGLRYLIPDDQGQRTVQKEMRSRSLFLLGGGFFNKAVEYPIPFVGFDYFDYNIKGSGQQVNFFLAGAANSLTWADPALGNTRLDLSANLSLIAFASADRYFVDGVEREEAEVKSRSQSLSTALGIPMGEFVRLRGRFGLRYENFQQGEDMDGSFIVPTDTLVPSVALELQFTRKGFTATGDVAGFRRLDWEVWGDPDPASDLVGSRVIDYSDEFRDYTRWSVGVSQDIFLKAFQKVRLSALWLDGESLDRFSRYQFSFFGDRLRVRGFSGSGMRFDRGILARVRYTFNMGEVVSFDTGVDHARVENLPGGGDPESHTGIGFAAKFVGPWGLLIRIEYGYALRSDIPAVEGEQDAQLLFLKIF
jgi:hypothetical protein